MLSKFGESCSTRADWARQNLFIPSFCPHLACDRCNCSSHMALKADGMGYDGAKRPEIQTVVKVWIIFDWPQTFLLDKEHICKPSVVKPNCNNYKGPLIFPEWHNLRSLFWENYTLCCSQSNVHHPATCRGRLQAYSTSLASIWHNDHDHLSNRILMIKIISKINII